LPPANPLDALPLVIALRESAWAQPALEIAHTLGFVVLVGSVFAFDLRVLGFSKQLSVRALSRHLLPWSAAALAIIVPSGGLLFLANADDLIDNRLFVLKMGLLLAAGINALVFRTGPYQGVNAWDTGVRAPIAARLSVALSLALWAAVISCGRLLAYI
jgi:hypothetical protein